VFGGFQVTAVVTLTSTIVHIGVTLNWTGTSYNNQKASGMRREEASRINAFDDLAFLARAR
jgi:succinate dehydrogenase hydrophobic anchor subunit